jgi:hypothetical protein
MELRVNENVSIGDILAGNIERDKADFMAYAARFSATYRSNHVAAIEAVRHMDKVAVKTGKNKFYTQELYAKADALQIPLRQLEGYVKHAGKMNLLNTPVENFGLHQVREDMHSKDLEGLGDSLEILNQNIDGNKTVLLDEGLTQVKIDELIDVKNRIDSENAQQELNKEDRNIMSKSDEALVAALKVFNDDILDVGKRIYRGVNQAKYDDYVLEKLIGRIRQDAPHDSTEDGGSTDPA